MVIGWVCWLVGLFVTAIGLSVGELGCLFATTFRIGSALVSVLLPHATVVPRKMMLTPEVGFLVVGHPAQSASTLTSRSRMLFMFALSVVVWFYGEFVVFGAARCLTLFCASSVGAVRSRASSFVA